MQIPAIDVRPQEGGWTGEQLPVDPTTEIIQRLRHQILDGVPWYYALLEAVAHWTRPEETVNGRYYRYLIGGEAFDFLTLAERLTETVADLIPPAEREALLFFNEPPEEISEEDFRARLGAPKYRAYLNYLYGVTLEEALQLAVELEIQKEQRGRPWREDPQTVESLHYRIYGESFAELHERFRAERKLPVESTPTGELAMTWLEHKEFTYWLFKYRLHKCDRARVASDTRKSLSEMARQWAARNRRRLPDTAEPVDVLELRPVDSY